MQHLGICRFAGLAPEDKGGLACVILGSPISSPLPAPAKWGREVVISHNASHICQKGLPRRHQQLGAVILQLIALNEEHLFSDV